MPGQPPPRDGDPPIPGTYLALLADPTTATVTITEQPQARTPRMVSTSNIARSPWGCIDARRSIKSYGESMVPFVARENRAIDAF
jgi:hypothetical protein